MIKGSHNTFTYLRPTKWYLRPFAFIAKCQNKTIEKQLEHGARCFDLRVRMNSEGELEVAHNAFVYIKGIQQLDEILRRMSKNTPPGERIYIRVLHEVRNVEQEKYSSKEDFETICILLQYLQEELTNIRFFGGQRTMDWRQDFVFPQENEMQYVEKHASVDWPKWFHWWPWLYAKFYNKHIIEEYKDKNIILFYDFL